MKVADLTIDLAELKKDKKTLKQTVTLGAEEGEYSVEFKNDIANQIKYSESGSNIVVTAYDTQEVTYKKVSTTISSEKEPTGKYRGKYKVTTVTYEATYDGNGDVNGYDDGTVKITYSRQAGTGEETVEYQTINSRGKVIAVTTDDVTGENKTITNDSKVLATVTYKKAEEYAEDLDIISKNNGTYNLLEVIFPATKSKNKYTGNWLQEEVDSTKANETFNLGVNRSDMDPDIIKYDMESEGGHGKDTIVLTKGSRLEVELDNADSMVKTFSKNKNNIIMKVGATADYSGSDYVKVEFEVTKSGSKYWYVWKEYVWDEDNEEYPSTPTTTYEPCELTSEVKKSVEHSTGIKFTVGTHTCYRDEEFNFYLGEASPLAQVTFKDYLKLAQDGVTILGDSLKEMLENAEGVGILGSSEATRKQNLTGTFLREQFYGGTNNDTITTGDDFDEIYLSEGRDTITVNGSGLKSLDYIRPAEELSLGNTTVKFAKGVEFGFDEEGNVAEGKTALSLASITDKLRDSYYGFEKSGNDLIIDSDAIKKLKKRFGADVELENKTLTIKDFFAEKGAINGTIFGYDSDHLPVTFDDYGVSVYQFGNEKKANKMQDTKYDDMLIGGNKADKFTVSNGDAHIFGLKGNDTIDVVKGAEGTVSIAETMGSGNDTLNIDSEVCDSVEFMIDGAYSKMMSSDKADISFEKTGNDLIFNMTYFKDADAGIRKDINDSLTVKNFFNNDFDIAFGYKSAEPDDWYDVNAALGKKLIVNGVKDTDKTSPTYKKTVFGGTDYADSMTYAGKGAAFMSGGLFNDEYNVKLSKNTDVIIEDEDGKNVVNLDCSSKNFRVFFNANKDGIVTTSGDNETDDLLVFSKDSFTKNNLVKGYNASGKIDMDSFFTYDEEELEIGAHFKFTATGSEEVEMDTYVSTLANNVAGWLSEHTDYADAFAVLESGNTADINSLITVYNVEYSNPS